MKKWLVVIVLALGAGGAGGYFGRPTIDHAAGMGSELEASVVGERRDEDRLVLTLRAGQDTFLATFRNRVDDIAELVEPGDTITLRTRSTTVFADDVPIVRVSHAGSTADPAIADPATADPATAEEEAPAEDAAEDAPEEDEADAHASETPETVVAATDP